MGADRRPESRPAHRLDRRCARGRRAEERVVPRSAPCRAVARPLPLCAGSDGLRRGDRRASVVAARSRLPGAARKQRTTLQPIQYSSNEVARVGESPRERRSGEGRTHIRFHAPLVAQRRAPPGFRRRSYGSTRLHTCTSSRRPESSPRDALRGVRGRAMPSATPPTPRRQARLEQAGLGGGRSVGSRWAGAVGAELHRSLYGDNPPERPPIPRGPVKVRTAAYASRRPGSPASPDTSPRCGARS